MRGKATPAFLIALALLAGCGSDEDEGTPNSVAANAAPYVSAESAAVTFIDWAALKETLEFEDTSSSDPDDFYTALLEAAGDLGPLYSNTAITDEEPMALGFGPPDLESEVLIEVEDGVPLSVLGFPEEFGFEAVEDALSECSYSSEEIENGTLYTRELQAPCGDIDSSLGIPSPSVASIAVMPDDAMMLTASSPEPIETALEESAESSLDPVLSDLGGALDGVVAGTIAYGELGCPSFGISAALGPSATPEQLEAIEEEQGTAGDPYESLLVGYETGGDAFSGIIALDHADADAADAALESRENAISEGVTLTAQQPYSELFQLDQAEVEDDAVIFNVSAPSEGRPLKLLSAAALRDLTFAGC